MARRIALVAVVVLLGIHGALSTSAQDELSQSGRRPTLAERLQRFRTELLGEPTSKQRPEADAAPAMPRSTRAAASQQRPVMVAPPGPHPLENQYSTSEVPSQAPAARPLTSSAGGAISVSPRMQTQSARRAKPTDTQAPTNVVPTHGPRSLAPNQGVVRRPLEEARLRERQPLVEEEDFDDEPEPSRYEPTPAVASQEMLDEPDAAFDESDFDEDRFDEERWDEDEYPQAVPAGRPSPAVAPQAVHDDEPYDAYDDEEPIEVIEVPASRSRFGRNTLRASEPTIAEPQTEAEPQPTPAVPPDEPTPAVPPADEQDPVTPHEPSRHEPSRQAASAVPESRVPAADDNLLFAAQSPVIAVEASGPRTVQIGKEAEFVVKVKNAGAAARGVAIRINLPSYADVAGARPSSGSVQPPGRGDAHGAIEWTMEHLDADSEEKLVLKLIPRKSSPLDLAISYTFSPETSQAMVEVQEPMLAMSLSGPNEVLFGQTKIYKLTISNPGTGDTHNVSVGLAPVGRGEASGTHRLGTLKAGESKTIDIELTARQAGEITIRAQSFADGGLRAETAEHVLVRRADLQVRVDAPRVKYAGTEGMYQLTIENSGDAAAESVHASAILPPEARFISATGGGRFDPQQGRVDWTVGSLPAGGQRVLELQCSLMAPGDNHLQLSAEAAGDLAASDTSTTRVEAIADLKLEVRDPRGPIAVGDDAVYEIRIRNRGTKAAHGVDLAVFFSEGLEASAAEGGAHVIGEGQVIFKPIAAIAAGGEAVVTIRARAEEPGNHVFRAEVLCESLKTKLAAEEATHFYGDQLTARRNEPRPATPPANLYDADDEDDPPPGGDF